MVTTTRPLCLLVLCCLDLATAKVAKAALNVLMLAADDLRPQLNCFAPETWVGRHVPMATPATDELASRPGSVVFMRSYCQIALCGPTRASLLTGRRPDTTNVHTIGPYWRDVGGNFTTLPQHFKGSGYRSGSPSAPAAAHQAVPRACPRAFAHPARGPAAAPAARGQCAALLAAQALPRGPPSGLGPACAYEPQQPPCSQRAASFQRQRVVVGLAPAMTGCVRRATVAAASTASARSSTRARPVGGPPPATSTRAPPTRGSLATTTRTRGPRATLSSPTTSTPRTRFSGSAAPRRGTTQRARLGGCTSGSRRRTRR